MASLPSATPGASYLTVELDGCGQIQNVVANTYESVGKEDPGFDYDFGLLEFNTPCNTSKLKIYYHGAKDLTGMVYRKYGPMPANWNLST